ncbi:MAG: dihydropteroate synthase, partial [Pyrinomonadaceae bacterium]
MAILNVTPDSFADGGKYAGLDAAIRQAEKYVADGADLLDIGGESTRPGSRSISAEEEAARVVPVIAAITKRIDIPISIDTTKSRVARQAIEAGAEIVNDISALRFDPEIAGTVAAAGCGLILMHSRGSFETMHSELPVGDIMADVIANLRTGIVVALDAGIAMSQIAVDIGIGFGKTFDQNLELLANLDKLCNEFSEFPMMVGTSRKSFLGKILDGAPPQERISGSVASALIASQNGANLLRVHDVKETVAMLKVARAVNNRRL